MINVQVFEQDDQDPFFYAIMGKYFADRKYAQEMGGWQFYNKENSTWFIAFDRGEVVGFCSNFNEKTHIYFDNFYVHKKYRGMGYSKILFEKRLSKAKEKQKEIRAIANNPIQIKTLIQFGFKLCGTRGRYYKYKLEVN